VIIIEVNFHPVQQRLYCGSFAHMRPHRRNNVLYESQAVCYSHWLHNVVLASAMSLLGYSQPTTSYLGIAVLVGAAIIMPVLPREKRRLSCMTRSAGLRADAAESALCAYLSIIALMGLLVHAIWRIAWTDPVAALIITPLIAREAREAWRRRACCSC
jgi:divalent metal cation (Fe/Co/Zn/Cd) transporter